jgi:hypothetical protein
MRIEDQNFQNFMFKVCMVLVVASITIVGLIGG